MKTTLNGVHLRPAALLLTVLFLLLGTIAVSAAEAPAIYATKDEPPFTVLAEEDGAGRWTLGEDLRFYKGKNKKYFLFLPGTADIHTVTVRYDGTKTAYDDRTGKTYGPGETYVCDFSGGDCALFEYDAEYGVYNRYAFTAMHGGELPVIYITLKDGDDSMLRINSSHDAVESGVIRMMDTDGSVIYNGDLTRIKGHGLTSYEASRRVNTKNSYNINLGDKAELLKGAGKSKKWSLLRIRTWGEYDATGISYVTAFASYNALVKDQYFNMCSRFVDVYIDGDYRGVYVLTERMDINGSMNVTDLESKTDMPSTKTRPVQGKKSDPAIAKGIQSYSYAQNSSVPEGTDLSGGYILEIMCGHYGECGFKTKQGMYVNIKSPAYPTQEMVQYIASYVQDFENALFSDTGYNSEGKHWTEYADVKSYAAQTLIYTFYLNWEIYRTSTYMTKDAGGVLKFGPVWDFESGPVVLYDETIFGVRFGYSEKQQYIWFQEAWKKGEYLHMIAGMNEELRTILDQMLGHASPADGRRVIWDLDETGDTLRDSQNMNWIRWEQPDTYDIRYQYMRDALEYRYDHWFNTLWNPNKYLLGLTVDCADNGDGTWTLTATSYGKLESDYPVWYRITDDMTKGEQFDTGESVTVPAGGKYYAAITGRNNAFCDWASGKTFASKNITIYSNVVSSPEVTLLDPVITGSAKYQRMLDVENGLVDLTVTAPEMNAGENTPAKADSTNGVQEEEKAESSGRPVSDAEWVTITAAVVLLCAVMSVVTLAKKKGGENHAV